MDLCANSEIYQKQISSINYFFLNSEVYLKYTSFQKKSKSINEVLLKCKQITFLFYSVFVLHLYFFLGSSLKVYLKYTSHIVFFCMTQFQSKRLISFICFLKVFPRIFSSLSFYNLDIFLELVLGKGPIQGLEHTLTAEKMYLICLSMVQKFANLKQKIQKLYQLHYAQESFQKA